MRYSAPDEISPRHPALPGHFPGNPVVPGVLLLARVLNAVAAAFDSRVGAIAVAKFHTPLKPAEPFTIELERGQDDRVKFRVVRGETLIASGNLRLVGAPSIACPGFEPGRDQQPHRGEGAAAIPDAVS